MSQLFNTHLFNEAMFNQQGAIISDGGSEAAIEVSAEGAGQKIGIGGSETVLIASAEGAGGQPATGGSEARTIASVTGAGMKITTGNSEVIAEALIGASGMKIVSDGSEVKAYATASGDGDIYVPPPPGRQLFIAGVDRMLDLEKGSLKIDRALTYQIDTCSFAVMGERPVEGEEVIVEEGGERCFAGIITRVDIDRSYPTKPERFNVWRVDCDDYTALVDRKLVVETYENMSASDIFLDIAALYCPDFTTDGVQPGAPEIEYIRFDYLHPSECFKRLCEYVGWHWYPDYFKDLKFFSPDMLAPPAPMALAPGGKFSKLKHRIDMQGLRNRVFVLGGRFLSDEQTFEYVADGKQRAWVVPYEPHSPWVSVQEGEPIKPGLEHVDDEADYDWMYNQKEKVIRCSAHTPTPIDGATVAFRFRYPMDVVTMKEDVESQQAIAAIQGGDGVYEHKIVEDSLITLEAAEAAALADLREHANPQVSGSFETVIPGWHPGQLLTANLPDRGIVGEYLIQKVTLRAVGRFWGYSIQYGGRLLGIPDLLQALVNNQINKQVIDVKYQTKFVTDEDLVGILDEFTATPRTQPWYCGDLDAICGEIVCLSP